MGLSSWSYFKSLGTTIIYNDISIGGEIILDYQDRSVLRYRSNYYIAIKDINPFTTITSPNIKAREWYRYRINEVTLINNVVPFLICVYCQLNIIWGF